MRRRAFLAVTAGIVLLAGLQGSASPTPAPGFHGKFNWSMDQKRFGGFSAIEMDAQGRNFLALSDRGAFVQGRITRDAEGRIASIKAGEVTLLKGNGEQPLATNRADSEGLAVGPDGSVYVSFEGVARVLRYDPITGPAENLPEAPAFAKLQDNSALEALAVDAKGAIYTLPERSGGERKPFPVYRFRNGKWDESLRIPRSDGFLAVGADFGPDGRFYLLERKFAGLAGFGSRLRRFTLGPKGFGAEEVLMETQYGLYDNLEGVSVWRDGSGHLTATMISDDNFSPFLATAIVEYRLPD